MSFKALENRVDEAIRLEVKKKVDAAMRSLYSELGIGTSSGQKHFTEFTQLSKGLEFIGREVLFAEAKNRLWGGLQRDAIDKVKGMLNEK